MPLSPQAIIEIDQLRWRFGHRSEASRLLLDPSPGSLESSRARRLDARAPGGQEMKFAFHAVRAFSIVRQSSILFVQFYCASLSTD